MKSEKRSGRPGVAARKRIPQLRSGAQCVVDGLVDAGCEVLFGYPGGQVLEIFDCLANSPFKFILCRHEQGATHMADGYARATGRPGCCLVTSGPGATNTVTGLATAFMDGVPLICICGQVALAKIGNDSFQEADVSGITRSVTKHNFLIRSVDEIPETIAKAFYIATTGKPGPVVIDIPADLQKAKTAAKTPHRVKMRSYNPVYKVDPAQIRDLADAVNHSESPLLYVGGGAVAANASDAVAAVARKAGIPVCATLMALGVFPDNDPLSLRMVGMHGSVAANYAAARCDLLISAGARFDDRVIGKADKFAPKAKIVHIDIDISSLGKTVQPDLSIHGDLREVLEALVAEIKPASHREWLDQINRWKSRYPFTYPRQAGELMPQTVVERIYELTKGRAVVVTDVGQNQMWSAQYYPCTKPRHFISSGGLGTMGFGLPAAIGAKFGNRRDTVVCISGDGGAQMNFQELVVAVEHRLPLVMVILNNGYLGMVRQWQELFYGKRYSGVSISQSGRTANEGMPDRPGFLPDFVKLAEAHGATACRVSSEAELVPALERAFSSGGVQVVECIVSPTANVYPMIPPGGTVADIINRTV